MVSRVLNPGLTPVATSSYLIDISHNQHVIIHIIKTMRKILFYLFLMSYTLLLAQSNRITVMFYNTENLFDTVDDPDKDDDEYTPVGSRHWTRNRYWTKIGNLCKVIAAADEDTAPDIIGLCEVENDSVMVDFTKRSPLRHLEYRYVMTESADVRGIDVAFLYRRSSFALISHESVRIDLTPLSFRPTRDILHVTGRLPDNDTVDFYVCHWPSRSGGVEETEPLRMRAAQAVRQSVDSVLRIRHKPYIVIMGDLNGGCDSPSIRNGLRTESAQSKNEISDTDLVAMMEGVEEGSYRYEGRWDSYDHFIVSGSFLNGTGCTGVTGVKVFSSGFMLQDDEKYGGHKPMRTYNGYRYQEGYSDHLPIILYLDY